MGVITKSRNRAGVLVYALATQPKTKSRLEELEAVDFYHHAITRWPQLKGRLIHIPNEQKASARWRDKLKRQGVTKGVPDYLLLMPAGGYHWAEIELKRARKSDSSISKEQRAHLLESERLGAFACVAYGYLAALEALSDYLVDNSQ